MIRRTGWVISFGRSEGRARSERIMITSEVFSEISWPSKARVCVRREPEDDRPSGYGNVKKQFTQNETEKCRKTDGRKTHRKKKIKVFAGIIIYQWQKKKKDK